MALSDIRAYTDGTTDPLLSALSEVAKKEGKVYVLMERSAHPLASEQEAALFRLRAAGANVKEDSPEITLHTKFLVIDRRVVVVGSTHWTKTALTGSIQVDLVLEEPAVAALFRQFFFYLWEGKVDTKTQLPSRPWPEPALIPLLDFPDSKANFTALHHLLGQAQREVSLLLYELAFYPAYSDSPSTLLLQALVEAARRGIKVRVLLESGERDTRLAETNKLGAAWLSAYGIEVRFDSPQTIMHAKCSFVDGCHVWVSSANWNYYSLAKNVEGGVLILGAPELANPLGAYFLNLWEVCVPLR